MPDIATVWNVDHGDWARDPVTGLVAGDDLTTAVLISLFTDRTTSADDVIPDGSGDPRGWWGDDPDYPIGSKLWLRRRAKQTPDILELVKGDIADALQWLLDDQVASTIAITTEFTRPGMLGAQVTITRASGEVRPLQFEWAWREA
jgi:phage gp46-like protein